MERRILCIMGVLIASIACSSEDTTQATGATTSGGGGAAPSTASGAGGGAPIGACPQQHDDTTGDGHAVIVCDGLHPEAPFVRPPADTAATAFVATDGMRLHARGGPPRDLSSEERAVMGLDVVSDTLEQRRYGFAIYRVGLDETGAVTSSAPAILIDDALLLGFLAGRTAEGHVSRHEPDASNPSFEYEQRPSLPIRIRFASVQPSSDPPDPGYDITERSELVVPIENLSQAVLSSAGACLPPLGAAGAANPFAGMASVTLRGTRVPSMHGPSDNELVLDGASVLNHMTGSWMLLPQHLLLGDGITFPPADFGPHGNPLAMPRLSLAIVEGGGDPCTL